MFKAFVFASALSIFAFTAGSSCVARAENIVRQPYYYLWHPPVFLHYDRIYKGRYWAYSYDIGWNLQDYYIDVPHWTPGYYTMEPYPEEQRISGDVRLPDGVKLLR